MKNVIAVTLALFVAFSAFAQEKSVPNTDVKDVKTNKKMSFNQAFEKDKVTLVNFWATWCVPCKKEIKNVCKKMDEWKQEADFNYMTVSMDEARAEALVRSYAKSQGWTFPYYVDTNQDLMRSLNFRTVPFTIIVNKEGKIVYTHQGYEEGSENELFEKIKEYAAM